MAHQSTTWGSLQASAPAHAPSKKRWIWVLPVVFFALLGAAASWYFYPDATTARGDFALDLQRAGTDYRIAWDAHSPAVMAAKRGTLHIKDGGYEKDLALDAEQLASTGVVYSPATTDVSFRLELFGGPAPAVATVRLLAGNRPQVAAETPAVAETAPPVVTAPPPVEQAPPPIDEIVAAAADAPAPTTMAAAPKPAEVTDPATR